MDLVEEKNDISFKVLNQATFICISKSTEKYGEI